MNPRGFQVISGQLADHDLYGFWTVGDTPDPSIPNLALEDPPTGGGAEALSGTAALTLTATGGLTSATALTGAATLAITADGALVATTSLSGEATLALTATGNLDATTSLSGSASLAITASGALEGTATLSGVTALTLEAAGDLSIAAAPIEVDFFDTHDGISRAKPQEVQLEKYRTRLQDIQEALRKHSDPQETDDPKSLPVELTRLLSPAGRKNTARREAERIIRENDEFAIVLALMN